MKINERGYWENSTPEGHGHDEGLAKGIAEFLKEQPRDFPVIDVLDIGCGDGYYTQYLNSYPEFSDNGYFVCHGIDGNPNTKLLAQQKGFWSDNVWTEDVSKPLPFYHKYDWVLSLEVGEHIPAEYEKTFLQNLDTHNKYGIILSWAVRGQGGDGHVNCQDNHEIIEKISNMGYTFDFEASQTLRNSAATYPTPCYWFRDTLMVFRRNNAV